MGIELWSIKGMIRLIYSLMRVVIVIEFGGCNTTFCDRSYYYRNVTSLSKKKFNYFKWCWFNFYKTLYHMVHHNRCVYGISCLVHGRYTLDDQGIISLNAQIVMTFVVIFHATTI